MHVGRGKIMANKKMLSIAVIFLFVYSLVILPQVVYCQTDAPTSTAPTEEAQPGNGPDLILIAGIAAVVVVIVVVAVMFMRKKNKGVNEKSLRTAPSSAVIDWALKKFNGKPIDPSTGISGLTAGGQPLLILQSDNVNSTDVEAFVDTLIKGKAKKGTIVAFNFADTLDGKVKAMDNEIDLQMFRISELLNKRYVNKIKALAQAQVSFTPSQSHTPTYTSQEGHVEAVLQEPLSRVSETKPFSAILDMPPRKGLKPRVFISNSSTKVTSQVKDMLDFLQYDYVIGDKEEASVPISDSKFGLMKECDCAIINIAAAEQERRYSGLYILNPNIISEINAAYLKYNTQIVLLVERKIELPPNLKGVKRIEYDSDDLSFSAAMSLQKILSNFNKT
jgi:hypothetical protein